MMRYCKSGGARRRSGPRGLRAAGLGLAALLATTLVSAMAPPPESARGGGPRILYSYPSGTVLEDVLVDEDGSLLIANYLERRIDRLTPDGRMETFATLAAHPVALARDGDGYLVVAHGQSYLSEPRFTATQQLLLLEASGRAWASMPIPEAYFLSGVAALEDGSFIIADAITATLWRVDTATGDVEAWLRHEALARDIKDKRFTPGANAVMRRGDAVYVSNSSQGTLLRVPIGSDGAAGAPQRIAEPGPIDGIWVAPNGDVYYATGEQARKLAAAGAAGVLLASGCDECSALTVRGARDGARELVVLGNGRFFRGPQGPARVMAVPLRQPPR